MLVKLLFSLFYCFVSLRIIGKKKGDARAFSPIRSPLFPKALRLLRLLPPRVAVEEGSEAFIRNLVGTPYLLGFDASRPAIALKRYDMKV